MEEQWNKVVSIRIRLSELDNQFKGVKDNDTYNKLMSERVKILSTLRLALKDMAKHVDKIMRMENVYLLNLK